MRHFSHFLAPHLTLLLNAWLCASCASQSPAQSAAPHASADHAAATNSVPVASPPPESEVVHQNDAEVAVSSATQSTPALAEAKPAVPQRFEGRDSITYSEFISELRAIADNAAESTEVQKAHAALLEHTNLTAEEMPLESFSRVRLAFESGRDSGLWGIRGEITDQMPWSDRVWQQWQERAFTASAPVATDSGRTYPTAIGECDELGALFVILARDMGVVGFVGLHWPYWNHVVPVWQITRVDGSFVRIVVPSTQSFLTPEATLGTTELPTKRVVFPYVRKDRKDDALLSADLARFLLHQSEEFATASTHDLTQRRLRHRWEFRE